MQQQQQQQPHRIVKIKLEENRQLVDCLLLKEPTQTVEFKLLYSKLPPKEKVKKINQGSHLGWAKILSNNQFISYVHVLYNKPSADDLVDDSDNASQSSSKAASAPSSSSSAAAVTTAVTEDITPRQEAHELPHILCTQYFKEVSLSTLVKTNNIKPPKPNADPATIKAGLPRLPIVPSYIYAQKRLFVKWRYEITVWWNRHHERFQSKAGKYLTLLQQFHRAYPEFRSVQTGKQWFFQVMKQFELDRAKSIPLQDRLQEYQKELKMATEGVRKNTEFVAPTQQRRVDEIRDEYQQRTAAAAYQNQSQQSNDSSSSDDSSSSSSSETSSDDDSDDRYNSTSQQINLHHAQSRHQQNQDMNDDDDDDDDSSSSSSSDSDAVPSPPIKSTKPTQQIPTKTQSTTKSIPIKTISKQLMNPPGPTKRKTFNSSSDSSSSSDTNDDDDDGAEAHVEVKQKRPMIKKQRR